MEPRVLLVCPDDKTFWRHFHYLRERRFPVYPAKNGQEALEMLGRLDYQLAIVYFNLPGMNGTELTAKMKLQNPSLRVILIAQDDNPGENQAERLLVAPAGDDFLLKQIRELFPEGWNDTKREIIGPENPFEVPKDLDVT